MFCSEMVMSAYKAAGFIPDGDLYKVRSWSPNDIYYYSIDLGLDYIGFISAKANPELNPNDPNWVRPDRSSEG